MPLLYRIIAASGSTHFSSPPFFISQEFTGLQKQHHIALSMYGKGCWQVNVLVERLWRSVKYEEGYLHAYENIRAAHRDWSGT